MDVTKRYDWKVFLGFENNDQIEYCKYWIKKSRLKHSSVFAALFKVERQTAYMFLKKGNLVEFDNDNNSNETDKNLRLFREQICDMPCICMDDIEIDFNKRYSFKAFVHMSIPVQRKYICHLMKMYPSALNAMNLAIFFRTKYMNIYNHCKHHHIPLEKSKYNNINIQNRFRMDMYEKFSKIHDICGDVIFDCSIHNVLQPHSNDAPKETNMTPSDTKVVEEVVPNDIPKEDPIETNEPELTSDTNNCTITTVDVSHINFVANVDSIVEFLLKLGFNKKDKVKVSIDKM